MSEAHRTRLIRLLQERPGRLAVAVSGGVDSLTLMTIAAVARPGQAVAVHAVSPAVPQEASERVRQLAGQRHWPLRILRAGEFEDPDYLSNPLNRCYFCKSNLFKAMFRAMPRATLATGTNTDDLGDFRPGLAAARESGVWQPFVDAQISKQTIRAMALAEGLPEIAALPAQPCLSSRIETGIAVRAEDLAFVHGMEQLLSARLGPGDHRCRITRRGVVAQTPSSHPLIADPGKRRRLERELAALCEADGRTFVTLEPYRRGSAFLHVETVAGQ